MWHDLGVALSLMLVIEGIMPFLQPARWRRMVQLMAAIDDRTMRILGFASMMAGIILLYLIN
ncbi:MAG: DUF2065 domain-containing protein [Pseudomonadales bacterium]|nr:DUF2065 domain-containing protein [Pseudomonadales bacterium]